MTRLLCSLLLTALAGVAAAQGDPLEDLARSELKGAIKTEEVRSKVLKRKASYRLFLPPGYAATTDRRYPVVVMLHGLFENEERWLSRGGAQMFERAMTSGQVPHAIVAVPEGGKGLWVDGKQSTQHGTDHRWRTWVVDEFLPHLTSEYRIATDRSKRVLLGLSAGGYGALSIAFEKPGLFGAVAAHYPMLLATDPGKLDDDAKRLVNQVFLKDAFRHAYGDPFDAGHWRRLHPDTLGAALAKDSGLRVRIEARKDDRFGWDRGAQRLHDVLRQTGITHEYHVRAGNHGWLGLREYLPETLRFLLGKGAAAAPDRTPPKQPPDKGR